jgi:hypothetical protein
LDNTKPITEQISLQKTNIEVDSEINQIESPAGGEQVYVSTSNHLYRFKHDGSGLHEILSSQEPLDQFAVSTSGQQLIYLSRGEFHLCSKEGKAIKSIPVEGEIVLRAISFSILPSEEKIVFIGDSAELGPGGPDIPSYRICLLDLTTGKPSLLSKAFFSTVPKFISWRGKDVLILNEDSGDFLFLSTNSQSEQLLAPSFPSAYKDGAVESVAVSHDGKSMAFSVAYPIDRVQVFIKEEWKSRMICELEGEGGVRQALAWSPNSQWLSYVNSWFSSPSIYLIPVTSKMPEALEASSAGLGSKVAWLPKSDGIAFSDGKVIHILKSQELVAK